MFFVCSASFCKTPICRNNIEKNPKWLVSARYSGANSPVSPTSFFLCTAVVIQHQAELRVVLDAALRKGPLVVENLVAIMNQPYLFQRPAVDSIAHCVFKSPHQELDCVLSVDPDFANRANA